MTRCYELYCVYLQNPMFCEEKGDRIVAYMDKYIKTMQEKGVKFDKSPEDKALFLSTREEIGSETAATRPSEPPTARNSCTIVQSSESIPLSEDVQKEVDETIIRARLSKEEAEDLVKVVKETPREELSRTLMTPRAAIMMYHAAKKPRPEPEAREWKPKEKPEQRVAIMHPQKSAFELSVIQDLQAEGLPIETDREFCVQKTIPDGYVASKNMVIYLDGPVHEGKEDRDERLRERLEQLYGCHVVPIKFTSDTKEERERAKTEIREAMKE